MFGLKYREIHNFFSTNQKRKLPKRTRMVMIKLQKYHTK